jgi:hypothetical protein
MADVALNQPNVPEDEEPVADEPIPFTLTPAATSNDYVDLRTKQGSSIYDKVTAPLSSTTKYDLTAKHIRPLLDKLKTKVCQHYWDHVV